MKKALLLVLFLPWLAAAQTQTKDQILKELDAIEAKQRDAQVSSLNGVLSEVNGAQGSAALAIYEKAVFTTRFDGAKGSQASYQSWQHEQETALRQDRFSKALDLHLKYLVLSLQAAAGSDPAVMVDPLIDYVHQLWAYQIDAATKEKEGRSESEAKPLVKELLEQGIDQAPLAKFYQVDTLIQKQDTWDKVPGDYPGILRQSVFPELRKAKNPSLTEIWDAWIAHDTAMSNLNPLEDQQAHFENEDLPKLHWEKAQDTLILGQTEEATNEMLTLIRSYPLHPDNPSWIAQLRAILQPPAKS